MERILSLLPEDDDDRKWLSRRLAYAHEPSLEARILECFRTLPFTFDRSELEKFARACADRRNDISHAGGPRGNQEYGSFHDEISRLAESLDYLFEVMTNSLVSKRIKTALANVGLYIKPDARPQGQIPSNVPEQ
jgi:hypothetical protein